MKRVGRVTRNRSERKRNASAPVRISIYIRKASNGVTARYVYGSKCKRSLLCRTGQEPDPYQRVLVSHSSARHHFRRRRSSSRDNIARLSRSPRGSVLRPSIVTAWRCLGRVVVVAGVTHPTEVTCRRSQGTSITVHIRRRVLDQLTFIDGLVAEVAHAQLLPTETFNLGVPS